MAGIYGADVSTPVSVAAWQALISEHSVSFGIVRCYESGGCVDPNAPASVLNGWAAGLTGVDVYHFPCLKVPAATQVQQAGSALQSGGAKFGTYWFDIESGAGWSTTDLSANAAFLSSLIATATKLELSVGIYTSVGEWSRIMPPDVSIFSGYPLWYAEYETPPNASFSNFTPFGGWKQPAMKQFVGDQRCAGVGYDGNWTPGPPQAPQERGAA
jgi:GH25 family lysozyme M1 (1,4-beta-N-acetylmuramidase)